jgi:hypothetical protein
MGTPVSHSKEIPPGVVPDYWAGSGTVAPPVPAGTSGAAELSRSRTARSAGDTESQYPGRAVGQRIGRQRRGAIAARRLGHVAEQRRPPLGPVPGGRPAGHGLRPRLSAPVRRPAGRGPRGVAVREDLQT